MSLGLAGPCQAGISLITDKHKPAVVIDIVKCFELNSVIIRGKKNFDINWIKSVQVHCNIT